MKCGSGLPCACVPTKQTSGCEVYDDPPFVTVIAPILPVLRSTTAVAAAELPPPPDIHTVGLLYHPPPPAVLLSVLTA